MTAAPTAQQLRLADLLQECYGRYLRASGRIARNADWLADADYITEQLDAAVRDYPKEMTKVSDLPEFLLARFAEDEAVARAAQRGVEAVPAGATIFRRADLDHIARWRPARVLAECEAKRELLALADPYDFADDGGTGMSVHADTIRKLLALPYADHPDYREEWRP